MNHADRIGCAHCGADDGQLLLCECETVLFCSEKCFNAAWKAGHCTVHEAADNSVTVASAQPVHLDIGAPTKTAIKFFDLLKNPNADNKSLVSQFAKLYPVPFYPYQIRFQDKSIQPRLDLDPTRNRMSVSVRSSPQRLMNDYDGPWTLIKGGIRRWDTGVGKTVAIHSAIKNFRHELVPMPVLVAPSGPEAMAVDTELVPRVCLLVTEHTLLKDAMKDIWVQNDSNTSYIVQKIRTADLPAAETPSAFTQANVISARMLTNMLTGVGPLGRKLWSGAQPSAKPFDEARALNLTMAPNAYRKEEGEWVRGNRPWAQESHSSGDPSQPVKEGYSRLVVRIKRVLDAEQSDAIVANFRNLFPKFAGSWAKVWAKNVKDIELRPEQTITNNKRVSPWKLYVKITWHNPALQPSDADWELYITDERYLLAKLTTYKSLSTKTKQGGKLIDYLVLENPGLERDVSAQKGYKLVREPVAGTSKERAVWRRLDVEAGETEVDYNPLNRVSVFIDEGHRTFAHEGVAPGERPILSLLRQAMRDAPGLRIFYYSATIDLFVGLDMLSTLVSPPGTNLAPIASPDRFPIPIFSDLPRLDYASARERLGTLFVENHVVDDRRTGASIEVAGRLSKTEFAKLANAVKGLISDVRVDNLRDYFASVMYRNRDPKWATELVYKLPEPQANAVLSQLKKYASVPAVQAALSYGGKKIAENLQLGSAAFDPESAVQTFLTENQLPAGKPLLKLLRRNDRDEFSQKKRLAKQGVTASIIDDQFGINLYAALLQAVGYRWMPVVRQTVDMAVLHPDKKERAEVETMLESRRSSGRPVPRKYRQLRLRDDTLPLPNATTSEKIVKHYGPKYPNESNVFVVLSDSLIVQDPDVDEPSNFEELQKQVISRKSYDTRFSFLGTVGELRSAGLDTNDTELLKELKPFRSQLKKHRVFLWPGSEAVEAADSGFDRSENARDYQTLRGRSEPVWFIHQREFDDEKGGFVIRPLDITESLRRLASPIPDEPLFAVVRRLSEFNVRISEEERQDLLAEVLDLFNSTENFHEHRARLLLFGGSFSQGFDVYDTPYQNNVDVALTDTIRVQRSGRYNRRDGMRNIPYTERELKVSTLVAQWPDALAGEATLDALVVDDAESMTSDIEKKDTETDADFQDRKQHRLELWKKRERHYGVMEKERRILNNIEGDPLKHRLDPLKNESVTKDPLDGSYRLAPYEALRVLARDPIVETLRVAGARKLQKMAVDAEHTKIIQDKDSAKPVENYQVAREWNLAPTNWGLSRRALIERLAAVPAPPNTDNPNDPIWNEIRTRYEKYDAIPPEFQALARDKVVGERSVSISEQKIGAELLLALFDNEKTSTLTIPIYRRMAEDPAKRSLYVGIVDSETGQAPDSVEVATGKIPYHMSLRKLSPSLFGIADDSPDVLLRLLELGTIAWNPNFTRVAKRSSGAKKPKKSEAKGGRKEKQKKPPGPEEVSPKRRKKEEEEEEEKEKRPVSPTAQQSSKKRQKLPPNVVDLTTDLELPCYVIQARFIGDPDEEETVQAVLYSNILEAAPFADDEQESLETHAERLFVEFATEHGFYAKQLDINDRKNYDAILLQVYQKMMGKETAPRSVPLEQLAELKLALVELFKYGITNWKREFRLLASVYLAPDIPSGFSIRSVSKLLGVLFSLSVYADAYEWLRAMYTAHQSLESRQKVAQLLHHWIGVYSPTNRWPNFGAPIRPLADLLKQLKDDYLVDVPQSIDEIGETLFLQYRDTRPGSGEQEEEETTRKIPEPRTRPPAIARDLVAFALGKRSLGLVSQKAYNLNPKQYKKFLILRQEDNPSSVQQALLAVESKKRTAKKKTKLPSEEPEVLEEEEEEEVDPYLVQTFGLRVFGILAPDETLENLSPSVLETLRNAATETEFLEQLFYVAAGNGDGVLQLYKDFVETFATMIGGAIRAAAIELRVLLGVEFQRGSSPEQALINLQARLPVYADYKSTGFIYIFGEQEGLVWRRKDEVVDIISEPSLYAIRDGIVEKLTSNFEASFVAGTFFYVDITVDLDELFYEFFRRLVRTIFVPSTELEEASLITYLNVLTDEISQDPLKALIHARSWEDIRSIVEFLGRGAPIKPETIRNIVGPDFNVERAEQLVDAMKMLDQRLLFGEALKEFADSPDRFQFPLNAHLAGFIGDLFVEEMDLEEASTGTVSYTKKFTWLREATAGVLKISPEEEAADFASLGLMLADRLEKRVLAGRKPEPEKPVKRKGKADYADNDLQVWRDVLDDVYKTRKKEELDTLKLMQEEEEEEEGEEEEA